jgi:hypothetical protein
LAFSAYITCLTAQSNGTAGSDFVVELVKAVGVMNLLAFL